MKKNKLWNIITIFSLALNLMFIGGISLMILIGTAMKWENDKYIKKQDARNIAFDKFNLIEEYNFDSDIPVEIFKKDYVEKAEKEGKSNFMIVGKDIDNNEKIIYVPVLKKVAYEDAFAIDFPFNESIKGQLSKK